MQIQSGKLYENKSWKYLYPCLRIYGSDLKNYLNSFLKLGVGLYDYNLDIDKKQPMLFILFNTKVYNPKVPIEQYREKFGKFLDWIRYQPYYVIDYIYDGLDTSEKHMVVLKIPSIHEKSYNEFLEGNYSKMYNSTDINKYFCNISTSNKELESKINAKTQKLKNVVTKNPSLIPEFTEVLNKEFGTDFTSKELTNHELDLPPFIWEETFNYKQNKIQEVV